MAISIVNGFVCSSGCDEAKARKGVDPHPRTGAGKPADAATGGPTGATAEGPAVLAGEGPAVLFGGALSKTTNPNAVQPASASRQIEAATARTRGAILDITV